ncbi:hypothetical protein QJS10_CPA16g00368 [Acorus calamus]|uniref:DUF4283 domain-containing protein n=1 Tax=Acorus calamus TaxID=4465 RepID=A0AAV9D1U3_ACOCL|nr:hypothetical protein QJS10_CPA16g00368 [Acorus calamus]
MIRGGEVSEEGVDPRWTVKLQQQKGRPERKQRKAVQVPPASTSHQIRSWGSLFQMDKPSPIVGALRFIAFGDPFFSEGTGTMAVLKLEAYAKNLQQWDCAIVRYIIGKLPVLIPFFQVLKKLCNLKGEFHLLLNGNGFFTVKFDLIEDLNSIFEGGPWTMDHRPFILRKWSPQVRMEQERLSSIPIWLRLPNHPLQQWDEDCLNRIGSLLRVPLYVDSATLWCSQASYARICMEVQASTLLLDSVLVEVAPGVRESFMVDYDWKPTTCKYCQTFGHDDASCVMKPSVEPPIADKVGTTRETTITNKGKEKVVSQWIEVSKSQQLKGKDACRCHETNLHIPTKYQDSTKSTK